MTRLEFFSGAASPDNETGAHGYDGSMSVESFDPAAIMGYLRSMDCIYGPCVVVVTTPEGYKSAIACERSHEAEEAADDASRRMIAEDDDSERRARAARNLAKLDEKLAAAGVEFELGADRWATVYNREGQPLATIERARVYDRAAPAYSVFNLNGEMIAKAHSVFALKSALVRRFAA